MYCDLESITRKIRGCYGFQPLLTQYCLQYQKHVLSGYWFQVVSTGPRYNKCSLIPRGASVIQDVMNNKQTNKLMNLSSQDDKDFQMATMSDICQKELGTDPVRDRDHLTVTCRRAAHHNRNLQFQFRKSKGKRTNIVSDKSTSLLLFSITSKAMIHII